MSDRTYKEENRVALYFNNFWSMRVRAYAYAKNIKISEAGVRMCVQFLKQINDDEMKSMVEVYAKSLTLPKKDR